MPVKPVVLVEYFCTDDTTLIFGVRAEWPEPKVIEISRPLREIRRFVINHFGVQPEVSAASEAPAPSVYQRVQSLNLDLLQTFFDPFIAPVGEWAAEGELLWLVPHDVLHYVPFHALRLDGQYLIERHPVTYTPSASVMKYCHQKRTHRPRQQALVLGDSRNNLPFAREEALMTAERFGTQAYLSEQATKALLKEKLSSGKASIDVLHFACHGKFDSTQPLKSSIRLSGEEDDQANLTVEEIFGLSMNADLVVLSACESGANERKPGDELFGLTRALIYAGTPSVVVTLWLVNDLSTLILMESFYKGLANGLNKAEALQQAQLHLIRLDLETIHVYIQSRVAKLKALKQEQHAKDFSRLAWARLLAVENQSPNQTESDWQHPFSHLASWAPFILVGDWK